MGTPRTQRVVDAQVQRAPRAVVEPGQQPYLPEGQCRVQALPTQVLDGVEHLILGSRRGQRQGADVVAHGEPLRVDPQRPPQAPATERAASAATAAPGPAARQRAPGGCPPTRCRRRGSPASTQRRRWPPCPATGRPRRATRPGGPAATTAPRFILTRRSTGFDPGKCSGADAITRCPRQVCALPRAVHVASAHT